MSTEDAFARHLARLDPTEPIFTERAFVEADVELDVDWEHASDGDSLELGPGVSWVGWGVFEVDLEIPVGIAIPDDGPTLGRLGDVGAALQWQLCCGPGELLDFFSLRAEIDAPTGDRDADVGGTGAWQVSLLPGRLWTLAQSLPDLNVQLELAYGQNLRLGRDELDFAATTGARQRVLKELVWNLAFAQQWIEGRFRPVLELLGTTVVDATIPDDEGTELRFAAGAWVAPFYDEHWLAPVSLGLGASIPLTRHRESDLEVLLTVQWSFGSESGPS